MGAENGISMFKKNNKVLAPVSTEVEVESRWMLGSRHFVILMLFLGMANAYIMRTNMSVAIVAMVDQKAVNGENYTSSNECLDQNAEVPIEDDKSNGSFKWDTKEQGWLLSSFFYGYVVTQIPFGILAKRYGSKYFLGIGMLINSLFGLLVPYAAESGYWWLMTVRFIQGLGEGPIVPCTHALLAKWIPPNERSRMGAAVYAGAQFGTVVSMPLSGLLSGSDYGWPSIFYVFGIVGAIWCVVFLWMVYEDPEKHPSISEDEKKKIISALWGTAGSSSPPVPWGSIITSLPFWAILIAHMGQNYGYETLMTELPTFMKQILHFNIKTNGLVSALPYVTMWIMSLVLSYIADWMITSGKCNHTVTRKIVNSIGQYGPAVALIIVSFTGCHPALTVFVLSLGVGLNGGIYSGFKVNHLDISPRFAGILMSFTNCLGNLAGLLAPLTAGTIIHGAPSQVKWRKVFMICAGVYFVCATFYNLFGSGERQEWDNPEKDEDNKKRKNTEAMKTISETQH
ncbi:hypothetical protein HCN44_004049 [Aphidius gifuensis]|uniref:Putative inorganic phosphate cotransporter n=1 Tax=Aphidius gifuensis TaxID=684658 RepID=A0A835CSQ8_APHGI|nr:putative inorganic phosphate cotransporter isoform X2 [Aphidius gifuensis]KAF7994577.1 hypothetical protein HCN44_004049 [Aphidius gifuensis]